LESLQNVRRCPKCNGPTSPPSPDRLFPWWKGRLPAAIEDPFQIFPAVDPLVRDAILTAWRLMPADPNGTPRATASEVRALAFGDEDTAGALFLIDLFQHLTTCQTAGRADGMRHRRRVEKARRRTTGR
jgi:hypothetical protein